jgi:ubiquitin-protein ligase
MSAINRISKKRFANEKKILDNPEKALHYATAFPSTIPGEELTWYFLIMGDDDSPYKGGEYIGKIVHHESYPAKPPDYWMLTPNGRYTIDKKICLSNSSYHEGEWSSSWNIITILIAFTSIWYDDKEHGISHTTDVSPEDRKKMAEESVKFNNKKYKEIYNSFNKKYLSGSAPKNIKAQVVKQEEIIVDVKQEEIIVDVKKEEIIVDVKDSTINQLIDENNNFFKEINKICDDNTKDNKKINKICDDDTKDKKKNKKKAKQSKAK